jgi:hypothetical protein
MKKDKPGNSNDPNQFQSPSFYNQPPSYPPHPIYPPSNNGSVRPPHNYRGWVLAIFIICFVFSWVAIGAEILATSGLPSSSDTSSSSTGALGGFATIFFIVVNIGIIVLDGRSFFSLFGRIRWRRLKGWQKAVFVILYLCGAIMPGIYLFFALQNFRRISQQTVGSWFQSKSKNSRIGIIAVSLLLIIFFAIITGSMASYDRTNALLALTPTATAQQQIAQSITSAATTASQDTGATATGGATATVGATPTVIPTATATPAPSPTHQPTPTHIAQPTPKPTPKSTQPPVCQAVYNNPWCFNFSPGNYITNVPQNFCSYFACIPNFVSADDPDGGYIVQCQDGKFSQSGGESGSCSHHGGNLQPLYSH